MTGKQRKCTRCAVGTETAIFVDFYVCDMCDEKPKPEGDLTFELDTGEDEDDEKTNPSWPSWEKIFTEHQAWD